MSVKAIVGLPRRKQVFPRFHISLNVEPTQPITNRRENFVKYLLVSGVCGKMPAIAVIF